MINECIAVNILDILQAIGEEKLQKLLSDFSSPLNSEVEGFVRNRSIEFAKKLSITYLVIRKTDSGERNAESEGKKYLQLLRFF